jgi:hypothetical protein
MQLYHKVPETSKVEKRVSMSAEKSCRALFKFKKYLTDDLPGVEKVYAAKLGNSSPDHGMNAAPPANPWDAPPAGNDPWGNMNAQGAPGANPFGAPQGNPFGGGPGNFGAPNSNPFGAPQGGNPFGGPQNGGW